MNRPLSSNLDSGRKLILPVDIAEALSKAKHSDGTAIYNADRLAHFIQQCQYWMDKAQENRDLEVDGMKGHLDEEGRLWFYNGIGAWKKNFPFWSDDTIRRLRDECSALGLVLLKVRGKDWEEKPPAGKSVTWHSLNYKAIDALRPPRNLRGGATCEGDPPGNLQGDPPSNLLPQQRVLPESTSAKSNTGSGDPASLLDPNFGKELDGDAGDEHPSRQPEKKGSAIPDDYTPLARFLCELLGQGKLAKAALEKLDQPGRSEDLEEPLTPNEMYDLVGDDGFTHVHYERWITEEVIPWWSEKAKGGGSSSLAGAVRDYDWYERWLGDNTEIEEYEGDASYLDRRYGIERQDLSEIDWGDFPPPSGDDEEDSNE